VAAASYDEIHLLVRELRLLFHTPAVLAKETGEQIEVVALAVHAWRNRIGKRGGHVITVAMLVIVAVVIIMAALAAEVKASPVFDRASLKEKYRSFPTRDVIEQAA
jgi:hypothetical protein